MNNTLVNIWFLSIITVFFISNLKANEIYGISHTNASTNTLYLIDPLNNTLTQKNTISMEYWTSDAVYLSSSDKIYLNNSTNVLQVYDRNSTAMENLTITLPMKTIVASNLGLYGITYNSNTNNNSLYSINLNSGVATVIATFTYDTGYGIPTATIIKSTGKLYTASSSGRLYEIDILAGSISNEYNMGIVMQTLISDNANTLYGIGNNGGKPALYSINTSTGNPTLITTYTSLFIPKSSMIDTGSRFVTIDENKNFYDRNLSDGSIINQLLLASAMQSIVTLVVPIPNTDPDNDNDGIIDSIDTDDDNDGMPDIYEEQYPGILDPFVNDADADADGDGYTNLEEYTAGTNPNDNTDYPNYDHNTNILISTFYLILTSDNNVSQ